MRQQQMMAQQTPGMVAQTAVNGTPEMIDAEVA